MSIISTFKERQTIDVRLVVEEASIRETKSQPPRKYLFTKLNDGTTSITGMMWNLSNKAVAPEVGRVYNVSAVVGTYNGRPQLTINSIMLSSDQSVEEFLPNVGIPIADLITQVNERVKNIKHTGLRSLVVRIYNEHSAKIKECSAAKSIHHVGVGGLLLHSIETHDIAMGIASAGHYDLNLDLIKAGALLHDIGKIHTYAFNGPIVETTTDGNLLEHITMGIMMLEKARSNCDVSDDVFRLLQHIIASHHGQLEYGAAVTPRFMEAYVVHHADNLSATLNIINTANKEASTESNMTDKIYACSNQPHLRQALIAKALKE